MTVDILKKEMSITRISRAMDIPRSTIYYRKTGRSERMKSRISENIESEIIRISAERTTYGYRRIWAILRNSNIHVNIKTVRRIMRRNNLALPYAKHKNRTRKKDLTKPENISRKWETDIHYVSTTRDGMAYLMSIKDCFSKKWISYEFSKTCTAMDCIRAVEKAFAIRFPDGNPHDLVLRTDNGPQYSAQRNIHDLPMEVWFRKVWVHPNSYGHSYVREDMAEAARMQNRRPHQKRTHISTVRPYTGEPSRLYAAKAILHSAHPQGCSLPGVLPAAWGERHIG